MKVSEKQVREYVAPLAGGFTDKIVRFLVDKVAPQANATVVFESNDGQQKTVCGENVLGVYPISQFIEDMYLYAVRTECNGLVGSRWDAYKTIDTPKSMVENMTGVELIKYFATFGEQYITDWIHKNHFNSVTIDDIDENITKLIESIETCVGRKLSLDSDDFRLTL